MGACHRGDGRGAARYGICMDRSVSDTGQRSLARRIVAAPQLRAPEAAQWSVEEWLAEIAETSAGEALARLLSDHPILDTLIAGLAEGSPDLWERVRRA